MFSKDSINKVGLGENLIKANQNLICFPENNHMKDTYMVLIQSYVRLQIKKILSIDLSASSSEVDGIIMVDLDVTGLPKFIVDLIKQNVKLILEHQNSGEEIKLESENIFSKERRKADRSLIKFHFRSAFKTKLSSNIFNSPFESHYFFLTVKLQNIQIKDPFPLGKAFQVLKVPVEMNENTNLLIGFNNMDYKYRQWTEENNVKYGQMATIRYSDHIVFGNYDLAQLILKAEYTNETHSERERIQAQEKNKTQNFLKCFQYNLPDVKPQKQEDQKKETKEYLRPFNYAHFTIPLYRSPLVAFFKLIIPGWLLGLISLTIFFQSPGQDGLGDRVAGVATIMLAFIAFTPILRDELPPSPQITFLQIVGYMEVMITLLCLVESLISSQQANYEFVWSTNIIFLICFSLQSFVTIIMIFSMFYYVLRWRPSFGIKSGTIVKLNPEDWENRKCNEYLTHYAEKYQVKIKELIL